MSSYDYMNSPVRVSVISWKENKADQNTIYFTIELQKNDNKWFIQKRFSEFDGLVKNLKSTYHNLPNLPSKSFLFKMTDKDLQSRKQGLQTFLRSIVTRNDLVNSDQVKQFLQLDKNASEMMVNPPRLHTQYSIDGQTKGVRDYHYLHEEKILIIATADTSPVNKLNAKVTNMKLPWESENGKFMEVGSVEYWHLGESSDKFIKRFSKGYPAQATCVYYDKASDRMLIGLEDGVVDVLMVTPNGYEDIVCVKTHQSRVTGVSYDGISNVVYSSSQDKSLRVSHGSSLAMIISLPHKDQLFCMLRDLINKRIFVGTKGGEVHIYDISNSEKPKMLTVIQNNKGGSIRALHLDTNRNYLFTCSYDDGELNIFDIDKPGKEKLAKMVGTILGKSKVRAITWAPKRTQIISGTADGSITFWNKDGKAIYLLQAFDTEITKLVYIEETDMIIATSKGRVIRFWKLPKEWRAGNLVADEEKETARRINDDSKKRIGDMARKMEEDSDEDELAGWHLD